MQKSLLTANQRIRRNLGVRTAIDHQVSNRRPAGSRLMAGLFVWWLLTQCFDYNLLDGIFTLKLGVSVTPDRMLFGVVILFYLFRRRDPNSPSVGLTGIEYFMILYAVDSTISYAFSGSDTNLEKFRWLSTLFTLAYQPFVTFYIARRRPYDRSEVKKLLNGMTLLGLYLGLTGLFEHWEISSLVFPKYILDPRVGAQFGRARGPFAASVTNGGVLIVIFLVATSVWSTVSGLKRYFYLFVMLSVALTIYFTDTRGIWVAFAGIILLLACTRSSMRKVGLSVVMAGVLVYFSGVFSKFSLYEDTLFARRNQTVDYRYANYETELNMFRLNPVFGIGYGNFNKEWRNYFTHDYADVRELNDGNNTTLLCILGEMGLVGICLYMPILGYAVFICVSAYRRLTGEEWAFERRFVIVTAGSLLAFLIMGVTTDLRFHEFFNVALFLFLGIVSSLRFVSKPPEDDEEPVLKTLNRRVGLQPSSSARRLGPAVPAKPLLFAN
jgi:O-antigen ligase